MSRDHEGRSREEVRAAVREEGMHKVILDDMVRLGFWDPNGGQNAEYTTLVAEASRLQRKLRQLQHELANTHDIEAMRQAAHKARLKAARAKRAETKARREQARKERAAAWALRKQKELLYLGEGVSEQLTEGPSGDAGKVARLGLPALPDHAALANALGESIPGLRWLAFHREVSRTSHYVRFTIPKKTGGERLISAPMPRLKAAQTTIASWLSQLPLHDAAHGFVPGRSIVTNAAAHVGRSVVVNFDLQDFFPSIGWLRVRGIFEQLGYSRAVATPLALLCTEADVEEMEVDGVRWFVQVGGRHLPQGSPASPVLTNLLCRRLDARLAGLALRLGFDYTRYADDLTFSARRDVVTPDTRLLLKCVPQIVGSEDLTVHPKKTRVMRRGRRQEVTGLVVNERLGVPREQLRRYRAVVHKVRSKGPKGLRWGSAADLFNGLMGFAAFVHMVDADKGRAMLAEVRSLGAAHGWTPPRPPAAQAATEPEAATESTDEAPAAEDLWTYLTGGEKKKWWQVWR